LGIDGTDDYIDLGDKSSLQPTEALSVSVWVYRTGDGTGSVPGIVHTSTRAGFNGYVLYYVPGENVVKFSIGDTSWGTAITDGDLSLNTWTHLMGIWSGSVVAIYVDGVLQSTTASKSTIDYVASVITDIGFYGTDYEFEGSIDEVAIWNRDLSVSELLEVYNKGVMRLNLTVRSCNDDACDGESWTDIIGTSPQDLSLDNITYFQYKFEFETDNSSFTPELYNVTVDYTSLNQLPIVLSLSLVPSSPKTVDDLTCSFTITDQDSEDSLTANITWYKNNAIYSSTTQSVTNGTQASSILDSSNTAKNEEWNCTIIPYDGTAYGNQNSSSITIQNSPPTAPNISLTPSPPYTNNDLNVAFNQVSQDNDSDTITYIYEWYKDSVLQPGQTTSTVSNGVTSKNEVWIVNVTPNDGEEDGTVAQANVTIQNSIPSITSASITPTTSYKTTTLTASTSGWSDLDNDPEQYTYQWFNQDGKINGATSSTLTGTYFNKSDQIHSNVTPYDSDDFGTSELTNTVTIQNSLPTLTVTIASDLDLNGTDEELTGSFTYTDADSDAISNNQTKWYKDDVEQTNLADLTTISYTNTSADDIWVFSARANDGEAWSNWYNASITILDISQTYPTLISPANGTYFNVSNVVLTYTTPNYVNSNCSIYSDTSTDPVTPIKNNTNR